MHLKRIMVLFIIIFSTINSATGSDSIAEFAIYNIEDLVDGEFMHDFLLIGPFPNPLAHGGTEYYHTAECVGFFTDYLKPIGGERGVIPEAGISVEYAENQSCRWIPHHSNMYRIEFTQIFEPNQANVAYAACWLRSKKGQEKIFGLGSNDGIRVWLNGDAIHTNHCPRTVEIDDDYLRLSLKPGKNLLLIKVDNGGGRWGFAIRPVNEKIAWRHIQEDIDRELLFEFNIENDSIKGVIGDKNSLSALRELPQVELQFQSLSTNHQKRLSARLGSAISLPVAEFPDEEYAIKVTVPVDTGVHHSSGYLCTTGKVISEVRNLIYTDLPQMPPSVKAEFFQDFIENLRWMDQANKFFGHAYGYRRYLDGLKQIHEEAGKLSKTNHPYDGLFPSPQKLVLNTGTTTISANWKIYDPQLTDDFIQAEFSRVWYHQFKRKPQYIDNAEKKNLIKLQISNSENIPNQSEGYLLMVRPDQIRIESRTREGLFYGVNTFLQLLEQTMEIPNGWIRDYPHFKYRGSYEPTSELTAEYKKQIDRLARLRYNMVYIPSSHYLYLDDTEKLNAMWEIFAYCKSRFIEPIPYVETFGGGTFSRVLDPCLDEGIFYEREPWMVPENGIIQLTAPRILDCPSTTLRAFMKDESELQRDLDFKILSTEPPRIEFMNPKLKNQQVLLSYDAVDFAPFKFSATCPSDPRGWEIEDRVIGDILKNFNPKYFHIGQDEAGFVNTCSRCRARGLTNQEIMIDEINRVYNIVRQYNRDVEIHAWGDQFNDYQNAILLNARGCGMGIPKDIVQLDWRYTAVTHYERQTVFNQMKYFFDLDLKVVGVSWFEPANVMDLLMSGERQPAQFLGLLHTSWADFRGGLMPTAEATWTGKTVLGKLDF